MSDQLINYLNESLGSKNISKGSFIKVSGIEVYVADEKAQNVDIYTILDTVSSLIPYYLMSEFDYVSIGHIPEFEERQINALTKDGVIYITSDQDDVEDAVDDIIHEIAHTLEGKYGYEIYADGNLEREFLSKREALYNILTSHGIQCDRHLFANPEYSKEFDNFLYEDIGYPRLVNLSMGLFMTPYGITSIREYWAEGFENYFLEQKAILKKFCPIVFTKIEEIAQND
tara:strand:- start:2324 stop:3010 length:687 start_codon:yes stop_codon:yes gene_type:complete